MSELTPVTEDNFADEVEASDKPVIVDFWAKWCGPCKQLAPRLEELDAEFDDIKFVAVDVDDNQNLAQSFGVQSIPTLVFFENGEPVHEQTGAVSKPSLRDTIKNTLDRQEEAA